MEKVVLIKDRPVPVPRERGLTGWYAIWIIECTLNYKPGGGSARIFIRMKSTNFDGPGWEEGNTYECTGDDLKFVRVGRTAKEGPTKGTSKDYYWVPAMRVDPNEIQNKDEVLRMIKKAMDL